MADLSQTGMRMLEHRIARIKSEETSALMTVGTEEK